jgi:predicted metal-dependent peptidase
MYDDIDLSAVERKLSAARTRLILDKPFLGALVLRLPLKLADPQWCRTTATDARSFYFNAQYIDALDIEQTQFVMAHEALHCALSHFARRQHRVKQRWDIACDYAINPLLTRDGLRPPPGTLIEDSYSGMTAEEIYPYIKEDTDAETLDQHVYDDSSDEGDSQQRGNRSERDMLPDNREEQGGGANEQSSAEPDPNRGGAPQPPPLSASERDALSVQWQQRLAGAAQQAMQAGKLGGAMMRMVDFMLQPQLPWRMLLARHMNAIARDDYSYTRPSTRRGEPAIFPSLRSHEVDVVVALDVSGSITDKEMSEFVSEIDAIKSQVRARVTVHACDAELAERGPWRFEPWEQVELPGEFQGGGGTRFTPIFDWVETQDTKPDLLVYFTDGEGEFPAMEPDYPVLWLIKGKAGVPWGQRAQLN